MAKKSDKSAFSALFGYEADLLGERTEESVSPLNVNQTVDRADTFITITSLRPDPEQPRSLLDDTHYQRLWDGEDPSDVLADWIAFSESDAAPPSQQRSAESLCELAKTIQQHGLIQPIRFRPKPPSLKMGSALFDKLVVVGERRWWAHVYLQLTHSNASDKIRALPISTDTNIKAIQLIENMIREDLNAVERADGIAALRLEMKVNGKKPTWTQIEKLLGIKRTQRWRLQQVHNLSPAARELVVQHNLKESAIRPITTHKELRQQPALQVLALQQLISWLNNEEDASISRLGNYIESLLKKQISPNKQPHGDDSEKLAARVYQKAASAQRAFSSIKQSEWQAFATKIRQDDSSLALLRDLRNRLNQILDN